MRLQFALTSLFLVVMSAPAQELESDKGKLSYAIGFQIGQDFRSRDLDIDINTTIRGLRDSLGGKDPAVAEEEMQTVLGEMQTRLKEEQLEKFKQLAEKNKLRSEEFLAANKKKKGIIVLPSGVQYRVIEEGSGKRPKMTDTVSIHYRGSLVDGLEFDSSFARGVPASFQVDSVLKGWQEVLPLMRKGDKWQVFLPPEMAYGVRGQRPIGPNEALQFDIHLLEIK